MTPYYEDQWLTVYGGDCRAVMPQLTEASVDAIVTDPPYGLEFMGKSWDRPWAVGFAATGYTDGGQRLARPSFGSNRNPVCLTCHKHKRGAQRCQCDEPTFDETPRSSAIALQAWHEEWARAALRVAKPGAWLLTFGGTRTHHRLAVALEDAGWELTDELAWIFAQGMPKGRSTLKPAHEPILMARKPAPRVTPLQIDEARIPYGDDLETTLAKNPGRGDEHPVRSVFGQGGRQQIVNSDGRWPANVVLTDPVLERDAIGVVQGREATARGHVPASRPSSMFQAHDQPATNGERHLDTGSYSRYFLIPKASRRERNAGLEDVDERPMLWSSGAQRPGTFQSEGTKKAARNHHPTIKPVELMSHLVRLVCPPGGTVLDPFIGSGSTAIAAIAANRRCIGIELDETYLPLIARRLRLLRREAADG